MSDDVMSEPQHTERQLRVIAEIQRVADIQRLDCGIAVVERVGPVPAFPSVTSTSITSSPACPPPATSSAHGIEQFGLPA